MDLFATVTSKGQVTIPRDVREALGIQTGDRLYFRLEGETARVSRIPDFLELAGTFEVPEELRGAPWKTVRDLAWRCETKRLHR